MYIPKSDFVVKSCLASNFIFWCQKGPILLFHHTIVSMGVDKNYPSSLN